MPPKSKKIDKKNSITFRLFQGGNDGKTTVWVPTNLEEQSEKAKETYEQIKQTLGDAIEEEEEDEEEPKVMYGLQQMIDMNDEDDEDDEDGDYDDDDEDEIGDEETEDMKKEKQRKTVGFLFPDDGYDYSKHIRNIGGGTYMSAFGQNSLQPSTLLYSESQAEEPVFSDEDDDGDYEDVDDDEDYEDDDEEEEEPVKKPTKPVVTSQTTTKSSEKQKPTLEELISRKGADAEEIDLEEEEEQKKKAMDEPFKLKTDFKAYGLDKYGSGKLDREIETLLEEEDKPEEDETEGKKDDPLEKYGDDYDDFFGELVQDLKEQAEEDDDMYEDVDGAKVYQFDNDAELPMDLLKKFLPREELLLIEEEEAKKKKGGKTAVATKPSAPTTKSKATPVTTTKSKTTSQKKVTFVDEEGDDDDEDWEDDDGEDGGDWEDVDEEGDEEEEDDKEDHAYTVSENRKQFDQDFESFYKNAYSDDQIGELDDDNQKLREGTEYDPKKMNDLLEDFFTEQRRKFGAGEFKRSNEITDEELREIEANLPSDMKVYRREDLEKLNELPKEERLKMALRQLDRQEKDESKGETEVITIPEKDNRWDCETILTSYSNIYNHPSIIDDRPGRKKKIVLSEKSGMPIGVVGKQQVDLNEEEIDEDDFEEVQNLGEARKKGETKEEKKERKQKMKELKQQKREMKKTLKTTFKSEQMKQQKDSINPANQQKVVVKY